jgi:hypothetical protein
MSETHRRIERNDSKPPINLGVETLREVGGLSDVDLKIRVDDARNRDVPDGETATIMERIHVCNTEENFLTDEHIEAMEEVGYRLDPAARYIPVFSRPIKYGTMREE